MMLHRVIPWRTFGLIVMILAVGHSSDKDGYACLSTEITDNFFRLHFNTTLLSGIAGDCSCKFDLPDKSYFNIETKGFLIQNCTDGYPAFTVITRQTYAFTCNNNKIETTTAQELSAVEHNEGDILWLIVSKTRDSPVFSGSIGIQSEYAGGLQGDDFSVICYEPNQNIPSAPTTEETESTSMISMKFSTSSTSTSPTTSKDPSISTSAKQITSATTTVTTTTVTTTTVTTTVTTTTVTTTMIPQITSLSSRESHENSIYSAPPKITSTKESTVDPENQLGNQVSVPAIAGGAAGAVAVLMIIVIALGIACYSRKKKSSPLTENNTDPNVQELIRINAVHDNNQPDGQDLDQSASTPYNTDQSKAFDSVSEDPEGSFTENTLYESSAKSQFSGSSKPSDFTLEHEAASSGDVYAVVWKSVKGN